MGNQIKMNMENTTGEFSKILKISLRGRNLALVYCLISIGLAILMIEELAYSLPAILGGLAMLWSFISHLSIQKPNDAGSLIQLQNAISRFRTHLADNAKYDISIVALWLLTVTPIYLKYVCNFSVYGDVKAFSIFCLIAGAGLTLMIGFSQKAYKEFDRKLKNSEDALAELIEFEKN